MKTIILIIITVLLAVEASRADDQRFAYYDPAAKNVTLYRTNGDGFEYCFTVALSSLSGDQQAVISGAMSWLTGQLATGETLTQVVLSPFTDYVISGTDGTGFPISVAQQSLHASISGSRADGSQRTIVIHNSSVPPDVLSSLITVWTSLSAVASPAPTP